MGERLTVAVRHREGAAYVEVAGELDLGARDELGACIAELAATSVAAIEVDLAGVTLMDSSGLSALLAARAMLQPERVLRVVNPRPNVRRSFEVTGLDAIFDLAASATEPPIR